MSIPSPEPTGTHKSMWGEGPIWHGEDLLYVDIEGHKIIRFTPATGEEKMWDVGERVGTVVARERGGVVYAGDKGISFLDTITGAIKPVADPETDISTNRFNDGKCDPAGRFWAGTMHLGPNRVPSASLYCLHTDLSVEKKFGPVTVSNGLVWTKDTQTLYYIDTPRQNVIAFDFDNATGGISNERVVLDLKVYGNSPDGMTIDAEDRLWVAFCHGAAVRCFNPLTAKLEAEIKLPCAEVTACAFGGDDLGDLYITTGPQKGVDDLGGRLFVTRPGVTGVKAFGFKG